MTIVTATEKTRMIDLPLVTATAAFAAQNDTVILPSKGAIISCIYTSKNTADSSQHQYGWKFNTITVALSADTYDATSQSIVYDGATASTRPNGKYYVQNTSTGEIMYVEADSGYTSTGGTITVRRGCLGTTAAKPSNDQVLDILNSFILTVNAAGIANIVYYELPDDPRAKVF
jgi:hypothetical protein